MLRWLWLIVVAAMGGLQRPAQAADTSLAATVPNDVGLCVEVRGLHRAVDDFRSGPWFSRLAAFPPAAAWGTDNLPRLTQVAREVGRQLDIEPQAFLEQVVGQEMAIAVWPGEVGSSEPGPGAVLVRAADSVVLSHLVDRWVALGRRGGPARIREAVSGSQVYYVQASAPAQPGVEVCVAVVGNVGVVANREQVMRQILELLAADASHRQSLGALPEYEAAQSRLPSTAVIRAFVQPRQWDALLSAGLKPAAGAAPQRQRLLLDTWLAADYWATALDVSQQRVTLESYVSLSADATPPGWRELLKHHGGNAAFLEHVPADALMAFAGRAHIGHWVRTALTKSKEPADVDLQELRRMVRMLFLGWDPLDRVLAQIGPDWGAYLLPSADGLPALHWVIGVSLQPPPEGSVAPSVAEILTGGIRAGLTVTSAVYNIARQQPLSSVNTSWADGATTMSIAGIPEWPAQLPNAFVCRANLLFAATSPAAALSQPGQSETESLADQSRLHALLSERSAQSSDILYVDLRSLRDWLGAHTDSAASWIAQQKGIAVTEATAETDRLLHFLQLADTAVIALRLANNSLRLTAAAE